MEIQVQLMKTQQQIIKNQQSIFRRTKIKTIWRQRLFVRFTSTRPYQACSLKEIGGTRHGIGQYQLQVLALQFNYFMLMKTSEALVKVQPDDNFLKWTSLNVGPFKVEHGSEEKKMVFVPTQGNWTNFQNAKYAAYILVNKNKMQGRSHAKLWQVYKEMSQFIQTRNFRQCKAHHQRMTQISVAFSGIVNYFRNNIEDFRSLLAMQMQSCKNFLAKKAKPELNAQNAKLKPVLEKEISQADKIITAVRTTDQYLPQQMKGFQPMVNQGLLGSVYPMYMPPYEQMKSSAEEWLECHSLFVQWTKKLQQLNSMSCRY